jgi:hypothetical protein
MAQQNGILPSPASITIYTADNTPVATVTNATEAAQ